MGIGSNTISLSSLARASTGAATVGADPIVSAPGATFNVADYSEPFLWLDAQDSDTLTLTGDRVEVWTDKINSYAFNKHAATDDRRPTMSTFNGFQALDFDGTDDGLVVDTASTVWDFLHKATDITDYTIMIAYTSDASTTQNVIMACSNYSSGNGLKIQMSSTTTVGTAHSVSYNPLVSGTVFTNNDGAVLNILWYGYDSSEANELWISNIDSALVRADYGTPLGLATASPLNIGCPATQAANCQFNGRLLDIGIWKAKRTVEEIAIINPLIQAKWGSS